MSLPNPVITVSPSPSAVRGSSDGFISLLQDLTDLIIVPAGQLAIVGYGGSAEVYKLATKSGTLFAVKALREFVHQEKDIERVQKRLNRELAAWAPLRHENIVPLLGICTLPSKNLPSMCSPYYANGNIGHYLEKDAGKYADKLKLVQDVADGLYYLHHLDPVVVHGDIKGGNVMVDDTGIARLSDFGLAKLVEELHVQTGWTTTSFQGSTRWQAPELLLADDHQVATVESDIWAFGCLALEILAGKLPYATYRKDGAIVKAMIKGELPILARPVEIAEDGMWAIMQRCWSKSAERPDVDKVKSELDQFVSRHGGSRNGTEPDSD